MTELSASAGSEGYGACDDDDAAPVSIGRLRPGDLIG